MTLYCVIRDVINKETCLKMVPNCNAFVTLLGPDTKKLFKFLQSKPKPFLEPTPNPNRNQPCQTQIGPTQIGPTQIGPTQIGTTQIRPTQVRPTQKSKIRTNPKTGPTQRAQTKPGYLLYVLPSSTVQSSRVLKSYRYVIAMTHCDVIT